MIKKYPRKEEIEMWLDSSWAMCDLALLLTGVAEEAYVNCLADPAHVEVLLVCNELEELMLNLQLENHHVAHLAPLLKSRQLEPEEKERMRVFLDCARERVYVVLCDLNFGSFPP